MQLITEAYLEQRQRWPQSGRHILAQYNADSIIVYQAYAPTIGRFAVQHGYLGGDFSLTRMSWIKPNFLWMAYRSGWSHKEGQEVTLAIRLKRSAFERILSEAIHSTYKEDLYTSEADWKRQLVSSLVRLQWDPDHAPNGAKVERRAIQLGLRGSILQSYAREDILSIEDISNFVREQYEHVVQNRYDLLQTPREEVYPVVHAHIQADAYSFPSSV